VNPWDWLVEDGLTTWPSEEKSRNVGFICQLNHLLVEIGFGISGARNEEKDMNVYLYLYNLPIWLPSKTGFCGWGSIVDGLPVDGRASNGAGLAGDRLICLWFCEAREP